MNENSSALSTPVSLDSDGAMETRKEPVGDNGLLTNTNRGLPRMAGFWRRFGAHLVDGLIISVVTWPFSGGFNYNYRGDIESAKDFANTVSSMAPAMALGSLLGWVMFFAGAYFYYGWFYSTKGQTPGKMLFKLKVVKPDLKFLDWNEAFIRDGLMKLVSGFVFGLGYFWYFANPKRQTWHDSVVHSYVVQTDEGGNILMDGQETYPVSKVKAFAFPCGCCLFYVLLFLGLILLIGAFADSIRDYGEKGPLGIDPVEEYMKRQKEPMSDLERESYGIWRENLMESLEGETQFDFNSELDLQKQGPVNIN